MFFSLQPPEVRCFEFGDLWAFASDISIQWRFPGLRLPLGPALPSPGGSALGHRSVSGRGSWLIRDITATQDPHWDCTQAPGLVRAWSAVLFLLASLARVHGPLAASDLWLTPSLSIPELGVRGCPCRLVREPRPRGAGREQD